MVNSAFALKFRTPCKQVSKCGIYHLYFWFTPSLYFFASYLDRVNLCKSIFSYSSATEKNFAARPLLKLYNSVNLPNFRKSPSFVVILRDLSTWSLADINRAGRSKTDRNTYESIQMNFTFNSRGKIWNCSLNLPFLHPMRPFLPTIQTLQLVFEFPSSIPP